jgi:glutamate-1-semialdehyde 2,1-aminomutase
MGERLRTGVEKAAADTGMSDHVGVVGRGCSLFFYTQDHTGKGSQPFRTLFIQEMLQRGVLAPSFIVSYSHKESDIDETIEAVGGSLEVYARAVEAQSTDGLLRGRSVAPVYRRYA